MWMEQVFHTKKPIIAMLHLDALPGDPYYNDTLGMKSIIENARKDLHALQDGGVDAVMFSNEFSLPYLTDVKCETVASMAYIIGVLSNEIKVPFGVNVLWDAEKSIDLAKAVGAAFVREIFTGVYGSDFGVWNTNVGKTIRHQVELNAKDIKLLFNIVPEAAAYLGDRTIESIAKSTVFNNRPDALCVSGLTAGTETDSKILKRVKDTVPNTIVIANTGVRPSNVIEQLTIADAAIVGTTFKFDGKFDNHVDEKRVSEFMKIVKQFRNE